MPNSRVASLSMFLAVMLVCAGVLSGVVFVRQSGLVHSAFALRNETAGREHLRNEYETQLKLVRAQAEQTENELLIARAGCQSLEKSLVDIQSQLGDMRDQLAFYEQLLPPGPAGTIGIRALKLEQEDDAISYRILLMRNGKAGQRFSGMLQFVATGRQKNTAQNDSLQSGASQNDGPLITTVLTALHVDGLGRPRQIDALTATALERSEGLLRVDFDQFQRSQGVLALPEGFEPDSVTVRVLSGSIVLASRRVAL